jgi:hypothetical protein
MWQIEYWKSWYKSEAVILTLNEIHERSGFLIGFDFLMKGANLPVLF